MTQPDPQAVDQMFNEVLRTEDEALAAARAARDVLPDACHVAMFETTFHQTIPPAAYLYALPLRHRRELGLRRQLTSGQMSMIAIGGAIGTVAAAGFRRAQRSRAYPRCAARRMCYRRFAPNWSALA